MKIEFTKKTWKNLLFALIIGAIVWYFKLPAFNLQSVGFWIFVGFILLIFSLQPTTNRSVKNLKLSEKGFASIALIALAVLIINLVMSPLFQAKGYAQWTTIEDGVFNQDIETADLTNLTLVDKESSMRLGDRVLGDIPEYVSQFKVSDEYTTVTCKKHLYRVTPLEYSDFIKYMTNKENGTPGYIMVNSTTGEATLKRVEGGMHYIKSGYFNDDLRRHIVMHFPTKILGPSHFEIDEEMNPWYVTPTYKVHGIGLRRDVEGVILTNVVNGENQYYAKDDVPEWVDHVYPSSLIVSMLDSSLKYQGGFWNTIFGQKNVRQLTPDFTVKNDKTDTEIKYLGYQYISKGNDVCLYSGVTSATSDESNLGFVICNLRTGEATYYPCSGAEEYSAMASARGLVQEKGYDATFPLLINLAGRPTYLVTLKDAAGLVKMYAFVDPQDYQQVYAGSAKDGIQAVRDAYLEMIDPKPEEEEAPQVFHEVQGVVTTYRTIVDNGTTYYYFKLEDDKQTYRMKATLMPFLNEEDELHFQADERNQVVKFEK